MGKGTLIQIIDNEYQLHALRTKFPTFDVIIHGLSLRFYARLCKEQSVVLVSPVEIISRVPIIDP